MKSTTKRAIEAAKRVGAPGTGVAFIKALDAMVGDVKPDLIPCPKCGCSTHFSNVEKYGTCRPCRV